MRPLLVVLVVGSATLAHAAPAIVVGKWKLVAVSTAAGPVPAEKLANGSAVWDIHADGTLDMVITADDKSATSHASWKLAGTTLTIDEAGQVTKMAVSRAAGKLHIDAIGDSTKLTFAPIK